MANVLNRQTLQYLRSVNTPDYPTADWVINPDLSAVDGLDTKYWKLVGDNVLPMTQAERDAVDAAEQAAQFAVIKERAKALVDGADPVTALALEAMGVVIQRELHGLKGGQPRPQATMDALKAEMKGIIDGQ